MKAPPPTVVLVDNDEDDQEIFTMALGKLKNPVVFKIFDNGLEAVESLRVGNIIPISIFIDMNMPLMSGMECVAELRKIPSLNKSDIFIYSTAVSPGLVEEVVSLGAKDFLLKPVEFKELVNLLSDIIFPVNGG